MGRREKKETTVAEQTKDKRSAEKKPGGAPSVVEGGSKR